MSPHSALAFVLGMVVSTAGCGGTHTTGDAGAQDAAHRDASTWVAPTSVVDILLVIDNQEGGAASGTIGAVDYAAVQVLDALRAGWSTSGGGMVRADSIHVAIISGNMGVGPVTDAGRGCFPGLGDDARFVGAGGPLPAPSAVLPPDGVFVFDSTVHPSRDLSSASQLQEHGCIRQQPLEAALKALSPAPGSDGLSPVSWTREGYSPPRFFGDTHGHGGPGGPAEPFLRPDSVLVVLIATPYDDCSTAYPEIFSFSDPRYDAENVICPHDPDQRYELQRYVDGLLGLRLASSRLVLGALVAVPADVDQRPPSEILAHPDMQERPNPSLPGRLLPSCIGDTGLGLPPRRIIGVAEGLTQAGASVVLVSSCELSRHGADFEYRLTEAIADAMAGHT